MGDFGGVLKNQSISVASADSKAYIHTAGIDHLLDVLGDVIIGK